MCDRHEITLEFLPHFSRIPAVELKFEKRMETQKNKQNMFFGDGKRFHFGMGHRLTHIVSISCQLVLHEQQTCNGQVINIRTTIIRSKFKKRLRCLIANNTRHIQVRKVIFSGKSSIITIKYLSN